MSLQAETQMLRAQVAAAGKKVAAQEKEKIALLKKIAGWVAESFISLCKYCM